MKCLHVHSQEAVESKWIFFTEFSDEYRVASTQLHLWYSRLIQSRRLLSDRLSSEADEITVAATAAEDIKLQEASTHKSAKTHAGNVFLPRYFDFWPFDPKINGFSATFLATFGYSSCIGFFDISCEKTNTQTVVKTLTTSRDCRLRR